MASPYIARSARWVVAAMIIGALSAGWLTIGQAEAGGLEELGTSLNLVPEDAAFYNSMLRNREQIEAIAGSRAWAKLNEMPAVQMGLTLYHLQAANPDSPAGQFQAALNDPGNRKLIDLVCEMMSEEVFFYGDKSFVDFVGLTQEVVGAVRYGPVVLQLTGEAQGMDDTELQAKLLLEALSENLDRLQVPSMVVGFKLSNVDRATEQLDRLEAIATQVLEADPRTKGRLKKANIGGHEYLTLSLDGEMIPWDEIPLEEIKNVETTEGDVDKLVARLKKSKILVALGVRGDYLLLSIGPSTDCLARLGQGKRLVDRPELKPLEPFADERLTTISYVSKPMMAQIASTKEDIDDLLEVVEEVLPLVELKPEQKAQIRKDAAALAEDFKKLIPEPGPVMAFSFLTDRGIEGYRYDWGDHPQWDGSKPLGLLKHLGGNPVLAVLGRGKSSPEEYELVVKWLKMAYGYFEQYAVPQMDADDREKFEKIAELVGPLVKRLDKANREMLIPALADGQAGLVVDTQLSSRQFIESLPETDKPMPMVEPALLIGVSDAKLLVKACREYRAVLEGFLDAARQIEPHAIPEQYVIPDPEVTKGKLGTIYSYRLPEQWGVDRKIVPNFGLSETVAVLSISQSHTRRLLRPTPLKVGGLLAGSDRPLALASVLDWAALVDVATPWVDLALDKFSERAELAAEVVQAAEVRAQIHTVLEVLKVLRRISSESYLEDDALVTHSLVEIRDVEQ